MRCANRACISITSTPPAPAPTAATPTALPDFGIPHTDEKLGNVRKVIARRLTEAKQTIPHIYLTVDIRLDALLKLRGELNKSLEADGVKLSVNDLLIKALARALQRVPKCNVSFQGDTLLQFTRQDISVAVAAPSGLITPIIVDAGSKSVSAISTERMATSTTRRVEILNWFMCVLLLGAKKSRRIIGPSFDQSIDPMANSSLRMLAPNLMLCWPNTLT